MRPSTLLTTLSVALVAFSCTKKDKDKAAGGEESKPTAAQKTELPAVDTGKSNALWELAPKDAVLGIVMVPGTGAKLQGSMMEILRVVEARPFGKKLMSKVREEAAAEEVNPLDPGAVAKLGLDIGGGAAMFMVRKKVAYAVIPVSDRAAFRTATKGTVETIDGVEVDKHDDDFYCAPKNDLYLCASTAELLKDFGGKVGGKLSQQVAGLPALYRGDAEFVVDMEAMVKSGELESDDEFFQYFSGPKLGVGAMRIGNGSFSLRGWMQATPIGEIQGAAAVPTTLSAAAAASKPNSIFHLRVPPAVWEKDMPKEDKILPGGLSLQKDVVGNLTGEFLAHTPSTTQATGSMGIGIKDPKPFITLLNTGCGLAGGMLPGVTVKPGDGICSAVVDVAKLPLPDPNIAKMFPNPIDVVVEVKKDQVEVRIGKAGDMIKEAKVGAFGTDLIENKWNGSLWTEGISLATSPIDWNDLSALPAEAIDGIKLGVWVMAHVYEVGMAGAIREDGVHGVMHLGTYAGDPAEAYAAYEAAAALGLDGGDSAAAFASIQEKWPTTMAGRKGSASGSILVSGMTGMLAAIAIPAFVKFQRRSQEALETMEGAQFNLEQKGAFVEKEQ